MSGTSAAVTPQMSGTRPFTIRLDAFSFELISQSGERGGSPHQIRAIRDLFPLE
jgi:hypothetical protein